LPLRFPIEHSLAHNTHTNSLVVRLQDASGLVGYGEGVPRSYVTGEDPEHSQRFIRDIAASLVFKQPVNPQSALGWLMKSVPEEDIDNVPAAACALETALLDLAGKALNTPVSELIGGTKRLEVTYGAVLTFTSPELFDRLLPQALAMGISEVKLKVGRADDLERLAKLREVLGGQVKLRVDANACWNHEQAIQQINAMTPYKIEAVEQPVPADDIAGLATIRQSVLPLILADESCCTPSQTKALIKAKAVDGFNLRISKCGGPARTIAISDMALEAGLKTQLGCQVGELGVLSAMGRHLACAREELIYLEGSLGKYYLQSDVIREDLSFGLGGKAPALSEPGLSVSVLDEALEPYKLFELSAN
jgi:L-alanine-DL-glutamate epimerase-like enolase superfamily enzyme